MKIAITVWLDRVSPVFDSAHQVILVDVDSKSPLEGTETLSMIESDPTGILRTHILATHAVSVLICGAISRCQAAAANRNGINVIAGIMGRIDEVIDAFQQGSLTTDQRLHLPGYRNSNATGVRCCQAGRRGCDGRRRAGRGRGHGGV